MKLARLTARAALAASLVAAAAACAVQDADDADGSLPEDGVVVPDGKEDDFFSVSAYEYKVTGQSTVTLEADLADAPAAEKDARVKELIGYKQLAISWFLTQYLVDKEHEDANASFGGFGGMAKGGAWEDLDVTAVDASTYRFTFTQIVAGKKTLLSALPLKAGPNGTRVLDLEIGKPSNEEMAELETNSEWYRNAPWDAWNPVNVPADKKETLTLAWALDRQSTDAWFDYDALLTDGKIDIDVHFGWDYHSAYHVKHASALFTWLKNKGFTAPVSSFDKLTHTSAAFKRNITADGRTIPVEVRIFYGKTGAVTDPDTDAGGKVLEDDMRESLAKRDVIIYSGHSGPFYGFALANWRKTSEGDLDDADMRTVPMPANRYQIVVAEGCDTYQIGEAFRENPAKPDGRFVDVITTTSFSNASTPEAVQDFLTALLERDSRGRLRPRTLKSLLSELDGNSWGFHTMYGIHGLDDNPAMHPFANAENLCESCSANADCGGLGNLCVTVGDDGKRCAAACSDDRGCPDGYACRAVASQSSSTIYANACVPADLSCE
jgi:hypothetical protein